MLIPLISPYRKGKRKLRAPAATPPVALMLVSAVYEDDVVAVTLGFNKDIDISGLVAGEIEVDDGNTNLAQLVGQMAVQVDSATVKLFLVQVGSDTEPGVFLMAQADNGIVAVDGSGPWAGCSEVVLPFP